MLFRLPYVVLAKREVDFADRWQRQFVVPGRDVEVGMWRREDDEYTAAKFGTNPESRRRRLIRFTHKYGTQETSVGVDFVLTHTFVWVYTALPEHEANAYWRRLQDALHTNREWRGVTDKDSLVFQNGDLNLTAKYFVRHHRDTVGDKTIPENYRTIEVSVASANANELPLYDEDVWINYAQPYRRGLPRGNPRVVADMGVLSEYFPMHLMLGCGPSVEAGIPPLNALHGIYNVGIRKDGKGFIFADQDRMLQNIILDPASFYTRASYPYKACMTAAITPFYKTLRDLVTKGLVLEPVINNNFDGLVPLLGMREKFIRRFEMPDYIPQIEYDPRARALLVVGNHADRRRVVEGARSKDLQIIFVDPEGYKLSDGSFEQYPIEDIQDRDLLLRMTAGKFAALVQNTILIQGHTPVV